VAQRSALTVNLYKGSYHSKSTDSTMANLLELQDELTRLAPLFDDVDKLYAEQLDSVTHWNSSAGQTQGDPEFNLEDCEPLCFKVHHP